MALAIMEPMAMVAAKSKLDILLKLRLPEIRVSAMTVIKMPIVAITIDQKASTVGSPKYASMALLFLLRLVFL
jgi:hypothetical protein